MSINLKTSESNKNKEKIDFGKALPMAILILAIILIAYGAIIFYKNKIDGKITGEQNNLNQKISEFKNGNAKDVLDFQNRISESKKLLGQYFDSLVLLDEIQKYMLSGVYLADLETDLESSEIILDCRTDNYDSVAKQIFSFKKSDYFEKVEGGETSVLEQEGRVAFKIKLKIKNSSKATEEDSNI